MNIRMSEGMSSGALTSADHGMAYRRLSEQMAERNGEAVAAWKLAHESFRMVCVTCSIRREVSLFEAAWDVASNPIVYRDQNDSGPALDQALALDDLGDEQAEVIREIGADYRIEWTRLSREMAELRGKMSGFGAGTPPEEFDDWRELQQRYQALEFQRDEASLRALRRLARYLEPDQRSRIGPSAGSRTECREVAARDRSRQLVPLPMKYPALSAGERHDLTSHTRARCRNQFRACDRLR